jgi:hypothetical protein
MRGIFASVHVPENDNQHHSRSKVRGELEAWGAVKATDERVVFACGVDLGVTEIHTWRRRNSLSSR